MLKGRLSNDDTWETSEETLDWMLHALRRLHFGDEPFTVWDPFPGTRRAIEYVTAQEGVTGVSVEGDGFVNMRKPPPCDAVLTNPPFSRKYDAINALMMMGKPFLMVIPAGALFTGSFPRWFGDEFVVLIPPKRMAFRQPGEEAPPGRASFDCVLLGYRLKERPTNIWMI